MNPSTATVCLAPHPKKMSTEKLALVRFRVSLVPYIGQYIPVGFFGEEDPPVRSICKTLKKKFEILQFT